MQIFDWHFGPVDMEVTTDSVEHSSYAQSLCLRCTMLNFSPNFACSLNLYLFVFLKNSQNSQENTCARVSFLIKLQASGL